MGTEWNIAKHPEFESAICKREAWNDVDLTERELSVVEVLEKEVEHRKDYRKELSTAEQGWKNAYEWEPFEAIRWYKIPSTYFKAVWNILRKRKPCQAILSFRTFCTSWEQFMLLNWN